MAALSSLVRRMFELTCYCFPSDFLSRLRLREESPSNAMSVISFARADERFIVDVLVLGLRRMKTRLAPRNTNQQNGSIISKPMSIRFVDPASSRFAHVRLSCCTGR